MVNEMPILFTQLSVAFSLDQVQTLMINGIIEGTLWQIEMNEPLTNVDIWLERNVVKDENPFFDFLPLFIRYRLTTDFLKQHALIFESNIDSVTGMMSMPVSMSMLSELSQLREEVGVIMHRIISNLTSSTPEVLLVLERLTNSSLPVEQRLEGLELSSEFKEFGKALLDLLILINQSQSDEILAKIKTSLRQFLEFEPTLFERLITFCRSHYALYGPHLKYWLGIYGKNV